MQAFLGLKSIVVIEKVSGVGFSESCLKKKNQILFSFPPAGNPSKQAYTNVLYWWLVMKGHFEGIVENLALCCGRRLQFNNQWDEIGTIGQQIT